MRKVEVMPELYLGGNNLIFVVSTNGEVYCNLRDRLEPFITSCYTLDMLQNKPTANIKMRFVYATS